MIDVDSYLARIGARRTAPDLAGLRELQERHLATVPFENLSIHLGEPIRLVEDLLVDKIVRRRRGGFCYELNGAFAALLTALGYRVSLLSAQAFRPDGQPGPPLEHLALRVDLAEPWLVDVGFGRFSQYPLRLAERGAQVDPQGEFRLTEIDTGVIDVSCDGAPEYRLESRPRRLTDFTPTCWYLQTSPDSYFTRSLTCSLPTPDGRVTLSGTRLIRTEHGRRTETELTEPLLTYRDVFGIVLDRVPTLTQSSDSVASPA
jgi:N-hydroxyarylamine O-acetyltransferase